jgi:hypothetical protein
MGRYFSTPFAMPMRCFSRSVCMTARESLRAWVRSLETSGRLRAASFSLRVGVGRPLPWEMLSWFSS